MKKYFFICLVLAFFMLYGCSNYEGDGKNNQTIIKSTCSTSTDNENDYFYSDDVMLLRAEAKYSSEESFETRNISAKMYKIKTYKNGSVFRFSVEPVGILSTERRNIYFYVTKNKIYRLWSHYSTEEKVITFYEDDELLTSILDTEEKLIANGEIVCQLEEISVEDKVTNDNYSLVKEGDKITYSRVDLSPNGEPYYNEYFVWELHKGLIEYGSSFKAEADLLKLTDISKSK